MKKKKRLTNVVITKRLKKLYTGNVLKGLIHDNAHA